MRRHKSAVVIFLCFTLISLGNSENSLANNVMAELSVHNFYHTNQDSVTNSPIPWGHNWHFGITNSLDSTGGGTVTGPKVDLNTSLNFVQFQPAPTQTNFPVYTWYYSNVQMQENYGLPLDGWESLQPYVANTKFTAKRTVTPEILNSNITSQTVTVEVKFEEAPAPEVTNVMVSIGSPLLVFQQQRLVEVQFINNPVNVSPWTYQYNPASISWVIFRNNPDRNWSDLVGKTFTFTATLISTKVKDSSGEPILGGSPIFKPGVFVHQTRVMSLGDQTANTTTIQNPSVLNPPISATYSLNETVNWRRYYMDNRFDFWFDSVVSKVVQNPNPPPDLTILIPATARIEPETLNPNTGVITAFVNLPNPYDVRDIVIASIQCKKASPIRWVIDEDTLILKFARDELYGLAPGENVEFIITGQFLDKSVFEAMDTIRVIE